MGTTVLTGPILAGNVLNSDGTTNLAGVGGSSGLSNVGFTSMMQMSESSATGLVSTAITQVASSVAPVSTGIVITAQCVITDIYVYVTTAFNNSATLSIGFTAANLNANTSELVNQIANASLTTVGQVTLTPQTGTPTGSPTGITQVSYWLNSSNGQAQATDQQVYVKSSATGTGTFYVVVSYIQGINGFTNGQYT